MDVTVKLTEIWMPLLLLLLSVRILMKLLSVNKVLSWTFEIRDVHLALSSVGGWGWR